MLVLLSGMFIVCGIAYQDGDINRLVYGMDSYGFACGSRVTIDNVTTLDLTDSRNLYYLNPLDLMSITNIPFAKAVCTRSCPEANTCSMTSSLVKMTALLSVPTTHWPPTEFLARFPISQPTASPTTEIWHPWLREMTQVQARLSKL